MADFTVAERDALRAAIASGVQTVTFNNRTVTYQSLPDLEDMLAVLAVMERGLSTATRTYRLSAHDKGV